MFRKSSQDGGEQTSKKWAQFLRAICTEINAKFAKIALELKSKLAENHHQQTGLREHFQAKKVGTPYCHQRLALLGIKRASLKGD